ncbi:MAG: tol-pal system-associated acyl-CoA thioesterase [Hyphomicrobiales bacterium]
MQNPQLDALSGELIPDGHKLPVRIYFEDTDFSGVVYHARYLHFFERGRSDFLRLKGVHHNELQEGLYGEPLFFVVKGMTLDFVQPAKIDDVVHVTTKIESIKGVRVLMKQIIEKENQLIATADVSVVLINEKGRPKRLPEGLTQALT